MTGVQAAITGLYDAFGTVSRPTAIRHEPYELQPGEITRLSEMMVWSEERAASIAAITCVSLSKP